MLTDTHAHLDFPEFEGQIPDILQRAHAQGIHRIITVGIDFESCQRSIALAEKYDSIYAAIGLHPCAVMEPRAMDLLDNLSAFARHPKVVAIGETGMDYHHLPSQTIAPTKSEAVFDALLADTPETSQASIADGAVKAAQATAFKAQIELARELGLNIIVHQRDAWTDTLDILRPYTGQVRAVFHCFGGTPDDAAEICALGHIISFTGIVTFKNATTVQQTAQAISANSYMVETDCPYLAPIPFRGKTCEPAHTRLTAEKIASLRNETLESVAQNTEQTANAFFRFKR